LAVPLLSSLLLFPRALLLSSARFVSSYLFFLLLPRPPRSTLFPYTTLFRSILLQAFLLFSEFPTVSSSLLLIRQNREALHFLFLTHHMFLVSHRLLLHRFAVLHPYTFQQVDQAIFGL